jgi:fructose-bisphosphate aldolase class II
VVEKAISSCSPPWRADGQASGGTNTLKIVRVGDMPLVSLRQLLDHAAEHGYGLPAFNVNNLEQVQAIMEAAAELDAPVIMQASAGARKYAGEPSCATRSWPRRSLPAHPDRHAPGPRPVAGHLHGAIRSGFSSVMMDGSLMEDGKTTVASYEYNVAVTRKVVEFSHAIGVSSKANWAASARSRR